MNFSAFFNIKKEHKYQSFIPKKSIRGENFFSPINQRMIFQRFYEVSKPFDSHKGGKTLMKSRLLSIINQIGSPSSN